MENKRTNNKERKIFNERQRESFAYAHYTDDDREKYFSILNGDRYLMSLMGEKIENKFNNRITLKYYPINKWDSIKDGDFTHGMWVGTGRDILSLFKNLEKRTENFVPKYIYPDGTVPKLDMSKRYGLVIKSHTSDDDVKSMVVINGDRLIDYLLNLIDIDL